MPTKAHEGSARYQVVGEVVGWERTDTAAEMTRIARGVLAKVLSRLVFLPFSSLTPKEAIP